MMHGTEHLLERTRAQRSMATMSRRALLARHGLLGAGVVVALARMPLSRSAAATPVDDGETLSWLLSLERQLLDFYDRSLTEFDEVAFEVAGYGTLLHGTLAGFADQEREHAELLTRLVTDARGPEPAVWLVDALLPWGPTDVVASAQFAENAIRHAYASAAVTIEDRGFLSDIIGIMSVEARHTGFLAAFTDWPDPAPMAIDIAEPLQPGELVGLDQSDAILGAATGEATPVDMIPYPEFPEQTPAGSPPASTATPEF